MKKTNSHPRRNPLTASIALAGALLTHLVAPAALAAAALMIFPCSLSAEDKVDTDQKHQLPKPDAKPADMTK